MVRRGGPDSVLWCAQHGDLQLTAWPSPGEGGRWWAWRVQDVSRCADGKDARALAEGMCTGTVYRAKRQAGCAARSPAVCIGWWAAKARQVGAVLPASARGAAPVGAGYDANTRARAAQRMAEIGEVCK